MAQQPANPNPALLADLQQQDPQQQDGQGQQNDAQAPPNPPAQAEAQPNEVYICLFSQLFHLLRIFFVRFLILVYNPSSFRACTFTKVSKFTNFATCLLVFQYFLRFAALEGVLAVLIGFSVLI